jgi:hypothetical protein
MAKRQSTRRGGAAVAYSFAFLGFHDGWYVLQADMSAPSAHLAALAFEGQVTSWLITNRITPGTWSHFGSGNTGDYPLVFNEDGSGLNLLLKRPADVLRLSASFACTGLTVDALHAAVQAEADVHIFVLDDAARIAHDAIRRLNLTFGENYPTWDDLGGETRVAFLLHIRRRFEYPNEPIEDLHEAWVATRLQDGWRLAARFSAEQQTDPLLVPWPRLTERARTRYRLIASVVISLTPLL